MLIGVNLPFTIQGGGGIIASAHHHINSFANQLHFQIFKLSCHSVSDFLKQKKQRKRRE